MVLYADAPARRALQVVADVLALVVAVLAVRAGLGVGDRVRELAVTGRQLEDAGEGLADSLGDAQEQVSGLDLPLIGGVLGEAIAGPVEEGVLAAERLAEAGRDQQQAVEALASSLTLVVAGVPLALLVVGWLLPRLRFARRATAARRILDAEQDLDLFALRAVATQPLEALARVSPDPAGDWRRGDPEVVARLAELELRRCGMRVPARLAARATPLQGSRQPGRL